MTDALDQPGLGQLATALLKAQAAFPTITRSKTVKVTTKTGGSYTFAYAPLEAILAAVQKPLADNNLALAQLIEGGSLVTVLLHSSGAQLTGAATLPASNDIQGYGSAITYIRRYAIQALLGIAAEEDDDGNTAVGNQAVSQKAAISTGGETAAQTEQSGSLTPKQKALIKIKMREAGLEGQQMVAFATDVVGKFSTNQMNSSDMDTVLESLKDAALVEKAKGVKPQ